MTTPSRPTTAQEKMRDNMKGFYQTSEAYLVSKQLSNSLLVNRADVEHPSRRQVDNIFAH